MTDRGTAIAMLAEAFGVKLETLTPARILIYNKALEKVPTACLEPMVQRVIDTRRPRWGDLPLVADILADAVTVRAEMLKSLGAAGCAMCEDNRGWVAVTHADGVRMERCSCWRRLQEKREQLAGSSPLALPAADQT